MDGKRTKQASKENADTHKHKVGLGRLPVGITDFRGSGIHLALKPDNRNYITSLNLHLGKHRHRHPAFGYVLNRHAIHEFHAAKLGNGLTCNLFRSHGHIQFLGREIQEFGIENFRPYPPLVTYGKLTTPAKNDFIARRDRQTGRNLRNPAVDAQAFHKQAPPPAVQHLLHFGHGTRGREIIGSGLIGAEHNRPQCHNLVGVGICRPFVHLLFQFGGLGFDFLNPSKQHRSEIGKKISGAYGTEHIGNRIANRDYAQPLLLLGIGNRKRIDCVGAHADCRRHGLRTGQQTHSLTRTIAHDQCHTPRGKKAEHTHHHGKCDLLKPVAFQSLEKLRPNTVADRKQEQQEEHILQRPGHRYVKLTHENAHQQHRCHRTERECLILQLPHEKSHTQCQEHGQGGVVAQNIDNPIHFLNFNHINQQ